MGHSRIQLRIVSLLSPAQKHRPRICCLRGQKIFCRLGQILRQPSVHDGEDIPCLVPAIQRLLLQGIEEFIPIIDPGGLHQYPIKAAHTHGDQLRLEAASVAVLVAAARDHLQLAVFSLQILEQHQIHVDCSEIIFQYSDMISLFYQPSGIGA